MALSRLTAAVITVTFNGDELPFRWADAVSGAWAHLPETRRGRLRVIAVDNASPQGTGHRLSHHAPWVEVLQQKRNRGFAAGCNIGVRHAAGCEIIVLVNPDVILGPGFFPMLAEMAWDPDIAAVGPCVVGSDGEVEQSARVFPRASTGAWGRTTFLTKLFPRAARGKELLADPVAGRRDVDWISGACMVIPASKFDKVGPFNEGYFMYWEDADWCRRAHDHGLRIVYEPGLEVSHLQGSSSVSRPFFTNVAFHRSAYRYYATHVAGGVIGRWLAAALLTVRCAAKLLGLSARLLRSQRWPRS